MATTAFGSAWVKVKIALAEGLVMKLEGSQLPDTFCLGPLVFRRRALQNCPFFVHDWSLPFPCAVLFGGFEEFDTTNGCFS